MDGRKEGRREEEGREGGREEEEEGGKMDGRNNGRRREGGRKKERKKERGRQTEKRSLLCTKLMFGFYFQSSLFLLLFLLQTHRTILVPPWGVDEEGLSVTCL